MQSFCQAFYVKMAFMPDQLLLHMKNTRRFDCRWMLSVGGFYVMVDEAGGSGFLYWPRSSCRPCIYLCLVDIGHIYKINPNGRNDDQGSKKGFYV